MATISHELRTPITVILGYASLLRDIHSSAEEQHKGLEVIESKARGLLQIISNIIHLAKVSAKREPLVIETCSLGDIAKEVHDAFKPVAEAKKLFLSLKAAPDLYLETDRTKVKQILVHLVDNAIKFTRVGSVTISVEVADEHRARIQVDDTGIGIEEQDIPAIFEEFRPLDPSNAGKSSGTGLGLVVCRRFVELLGGSIAVRRAPGGGSLFTVLLPGRKPGTELAAAHPQQPPPVRASAGPRLLLIADDDPSITRLFQNFLAREGYAVSIASGGQEALDKMARQTPDVLLLDLLMPDLTGFQVLDAMDKLPDLQGVKIIVITAKELSAEERAVLETRADLIIQKGSKDLPEILALLNQQMHRSFTA